ncbi:MAG: hypothetical protein JNK63_10380 [Chthonomonas sp.]|nr:hypothetical protein [Chthonomonas sp.]
MTNISRAIFALFACLCACVSWGYYDDVHYSLSYYIARQAGYTPQQSHRIASAASMVDWDPETEPVQSGGQARTMIDADRGVIDAIQRAIESKGRLWELQLKPYPAASTPRFRFHAFRNEMEHDHAVGGGENGIIAQGEVNDQLKALFETSISTTKNPGVFLHAWQDQVPHGGYGTQWGHNPFTPDSFRLHLQHKLPVGSTTDWIGFRPNDVLNLCRTTHGKLTEFVTRNMPHQLQRGYNHNEFESLVVQLGNVNPPPSPIKSDLQRQLFIRYYARSLGVNLDPVTFTLTNSSQLITVADELGVGLKKGDLEKHKSGPNLEKARALVNARLKSAGMADTVPPHHIKYDLDEEGKLANPAQLDQWVLSGSLGVTVRGPTAPVSANLKFKIRDANGKVREVAVPGYSTVGLVPGRQHVWSNLPIGDIILEIKRPDGSLQRGICTLTKRLNSFAVHVPATDPSKPVKPPVKPTTPPSTVPKMGDFTGTWATSQGRYGYPVEVTLSQSGAKVTGTWKHASGSGTISGTVKGFELTFIYRHTGNDGSSEEGTGRWVLRQDGTAFEGTYTPKGGAPNRWGGPKKK